MIDTVRIEHTCPVCGAPIAPWRRILGTAGYSFECIKCKAKFTRSAGQYFLSGIVGFINVALLWVLYYFLHLATWTYAITIGLLILLNAVIFWFIPGTFKMKTPTGL